MEVERSAVPFIIKAIKTSKSSSAGAAAAAAPPQRPSAKHYPITASWMEKRRKKDVLIVLQISRIAADTRKRADVKCQHNHS